MTRHGQLAAWLVLAACSTAGAQIGITAARRLPDGRTAAVGTIQEDPGETIRSEQAICARMIASAQAAIAKQRWGPALEELEAAQEHLPSPAQFQTLKRLYESCEAEGQRQLKAADALLGQQLYEEALDAYAKVQRQFVPLPSGAKARDVSAQLRSDPAVRAVLQQAKARKILQQLQDLMAAELAFAPSAPASRPADGVPAKAASLQFQRVRDLSVEGQDRAMDLLDRAAQLGDCPAGQAARKELAALKADKAFYSEFLARRQARQADAVLHLAQDLRKAGRLEKSLVHYRKILSDFPATPAARLARTESAEVEGMLAAQAPPAKP